MSELRKDTLMERWVIIAKERASRPNAFRQYAIQESSSDNCPFCPGNEYMTLKPILSRSTSISKKPYPWTIRVVPNWFPALRIEGALNSYPEGMYDKMQGIGAHEVVIESPDHALDMSQFELSQLADVFRVYKDRMTDLYRDLRFRHVLIFRNFGTAAGATLSHSHSQIIALPITPGQVERELKRAHRFYEFRGRCYYCDVIHQELSCGQRIVTQNENYIVYAPYASRFPFELQIIPRQHTCFFECISEVQIQSLAEILRDVLRRYKIALRNPPFNYMIHTAPAGYSHPEEYHWQLRIMPKLTEVGGFEWGSGFYINPMPPEEAARVLRELEKTMDVPKGYLLSITEVDNHGS